jgi:hypothetical protein
MGPPVENPCFTDQAQGVSNRQSGKVEEENKSGFPTG